MPTQSLPAPLFSSDILNAMVRFGELFGPAPLGFLCLAMVCAAPLIWGSIVNAFNKKHTPTSNAFDESKHVWIALLMTNIVSICFMALALLIYNITIDSPRSQPPNDSSATTWLSFISFLEYPLYFLAYATYFIKSWSATKETIILRWTKSSVPLNTANATWKMAIAVLVLWVWITTLLSNAAIYGAIWIGKQEAFSKYQENVLKSKPTTSSTLPAPANKP